MRSWRAKKNYVNPKHHRNDLIGYGRSKECKHGHPKGTSHLCAWHDVEAKFKERQAAKPVPAAAQKVTTAEAKQLEKVREQNKKQAEEIRKLKAAAAGKTPDTSGKSDDQNGDVSMEPDGPKESEKRAFIKARIAIYEARAKMSKQTAPEHRIEEDDANTYKQLAHYKR